MKPSQGRVVTRSKRTAQHREKEMEKRIGKWGLDEQERFVEALDTYGQNYEKIAENVGTRDAIQVRSHAQKYLEKLKREALNKKRLGLKRDTQKTKYRNTRSSGAEDEVKDSHSIDLKNDSDRATSFQTLRSPIKLKSEEAVEDLKGNLPISEVSQKLAKSNTENEKNTPVITNEASKAEETIQIATPIRSNPPISNLDRLSENNQTYLGDLLAKIQTQTPVNYQPYQVNYQPYPVNNMPLYTNFNHVSPYHPFGYNGGYLPQILPYQGFYNYLQYLWNQHNGARALKLSDLVYLGTNPQNQTNNFSPGDATKKLKRS